MNICKVYGTDCTEDDLEPDQKMGITLENLNLICDEPGCQVRAICFPLDWN